jgi:hypothetical protein
VDLDLLQAVDVTAARQTDTERLLDLGPHCGIGLGRSTRRLGRAEAQRVLRSALEAATGPVEDWT